MRPINKSLIANFSGKETSFFFKISPKVVFCTTVSEYGHKVAGCTFVKGAGHKGAGCNLLKVLAVLLIQLMLSLVYPRVQF